MTLTQVETELRILQVAPHKVSHSTNWTQNTRENKLKHEQTAPPSVTVWIVIPVLEGISLQFVVFLAVEVHLSLELQTCLILSVSITLVRLKS